MIIRISHNVNAGRAISYTVYIYGIVVSTGQSIGAYLKLTVASMSRLKVADLQIRDNLMYHASCADTFQLRIGQQ
jgi:hypothetical protein